MKVVSAFQLLFLLLENTFPTPIIPLPQPTTDASFPRDWCQLYPELDNAGTLQFLEDCNSTERFEFVPVPAPLEQKLGIHPRVCCPKYVSPDAICFPSDPICPTYEAPEYGDEYEGEEYSGDYMEEGEPTMSAESCSNPNDTCATLNRCPDLVDTLAPGIPETCGFDTKQNLLMVCCPTKAVKEEAEQLVQKPRFPAKNGRARKCENRSKLCRRWKEKGCRLDKHAHPSRVDPGPFGFSVNSVNLFDFMQTACAKECGWCGSKGCVDEHPRCPEWARRGLCLTASMLMSHTCRESCGVCGFLSPHNKEIQELDGEVSYTEFTGRNFDCGRNKKLCEINDISCDPQPTGAVDSNEVTINIEDENNATNDADADASNKIGTNDVSVKIEEGNSNAGIDASLVDLRQGVRSVDVVEDLFCGGTIIADRWAVSAAHCYDNYDIEDKKRVVRIRHGTPFEETIEIRKVYRHPDYKNPRLYNDVAVLELGRRIEYDFERFGDTPICIDQGLKKEGKIGTVQGYGRTESGTQGQLLEANVTVISNQMCKDIFQTNLTKPIFRRLVNSIPLGLEYGMMCTQGIYNPETNQTTGSCKGDSGGPLFQGGIDQRKTLIGIVSGSVACGSSHPSWLTRVESFTKWIGCILEQAVRFDNQYEKVEEQCKLVVADPPDCKEAIADPVASFFVDLRGVRSLTTDESKTLCDSYYSTGPIKLPEEDDLSTATTTSSNTDEDPDCGLFFTCK